MYQNQIYPSMLMQNLHEYHIETELINNGLYMQSCACFTLGNRSMLISHQYGQTIILSANEVERIITGKWNSDLCHRLAQKGFLFPAKANLATNPHELIQPSFFLIDLTKQCNFSCTYCFRRNCHSNDVIADDMLDDICAYIQNSCERHHIRNITIQPWGGEPLLVIEKILRIRRWFNKFPYIHVNIVLETNGSLLTESMAQVLYQQGIHLSFSFDGLPELHDLHRRSKNGMSTSSKVLQGIDAARKAGYDHLSGICVLTHQGIDKISDILSYARHTLRFSSIKINPVHTVIDNKNPSWGINTKMVSDIAASIVDSCWLDYSQGLGILEQNVRIHLNNLLGTSRNNICQSYGCCGGRRMISFSIDGGIYPCELTDWPDMCLGHIRDGRDIYEVIRTSVHEHPYFQKKSIPKCNRCAWYSYCHGGCTSSMLHTGTTATTIDEAGCAFHTAMYPLLVASLLQ